MLVLITLMLVTALNLGTTNFRAMTNMQFRSEAIAAANEAIEQVISSPFTAAPAAGTSTWTSTTMRTTDYTVQIAVPQCVYAAQAFAPYRAASVAAPDDDGRDHLEYGLGPRCQRLRARQRGRRAVRVRSGVRVLLSEAEKAVVCP